MNPLRERLAFTAAVLATALALTGCSEAKPSPGEAKAERPVLVQRVHFEDRRPARTLVGTVRPRYESDLGFRVAGKVARRLVEVGERVRQGDALATLDPTDLDLQRDQAQAELQASIIALDQAESDLNRQLKLRQSGWTTDQTLEKQKVTVEEARARRDKADYATLRADADGVVTATQVEAGQVVAAGQTAIVVARLAEKEAAVAVPETMVKRVETGEAKVSLWSQPGKVYAAKLRELSPSADATTRTYAARFSILRAGPDVDLGMTATVTITDTATDRVARLPLSALFDQGSGPGVWVVDPVTNALRLQNVAIAAYEAHDVVLSAGVHEGDQVVALGAQKLEGGEKVRIVDSLGM